MSLYAKILYILPRSNIETVFNMDESSEEASEPERMDENQSTRETTLNTTTDATLTKTRRIWNIDDLINWSFLYLEVFLKLY